METRKQLILILMFFGQMFYGQGNTRANAGVAYGSGINKNVENNSFRMEYWGTIGYNIVEDYEKAKVNITNKSKLKDLVQMLYIKMSKKKRSLMKNIPILKIQ